MILLADVLFAVGALLQSASNTVPQMILGRAVVGAGVGMSSFVTPLYIAELAPARWRGALVTLNVLCITLGQVVAYLIGWVFAEHWDHQGGADGEGSGGHGGWRWMVGLGAVPAVTQALLVLFRMPETPRWLVRAGRVDEAADVVRKTLVATELSSSDNQDVFDDEEGDEGEDEAMAILLAIQAEVRAEEEERAKSSRQRQHGSPAPESAGDGLLAGWSELVGVPRNRRALTIACLLQGLQQLCGFVSLISPSAFLPDIPPLRDCVGSD